MCSALIFKYQEDMKTMKTYESDTCGTLMLSVEIDGQRVSVRFSGGNKYYGQHSVFSTSNARLQKAIETSSAFGRMVRLKEECSVLEARDKINESIKYVDKKFSSVREVQDWMEEKYGVKPWTINTQAKCVEKGLEYGVKIRFENPSGV